MQKVVYICDHCELEIGDVPHVSLAIGSNGHATGIAFPPGYVMKKDYMPASRWVVRGLPKNFIHMHVKCTGPFFKALLDKETGKPVPKKKGK